MVKLTPIKEDETSLSASILKSCTKYSIIATDLNSKIIAWNEGAHRLYNYEPIEMIGKASLSDIHIQEDVQSGKILEILKTARKSGMWSGELKCIRKNGTPVLVLYTVTIRTDLLGNPVGYTIVSQDQTEFSDKLNVLTESKEYTRSFPQFQESCRL